MKAQDVIDDVIDSYMTLEAYVALNIETDETLIDRGVARYIKTSTTGKPQLIAALRRRWHDADKQCDLDKMALGYIARVLNF